MREILAELNSALEQSRPCVFCSVVETRGSTPQKAGAAMLVFPDGSQKGTLGGGCVEAEVRQRALRALGTGQVAIHTFCLDDNYGWDDGLICVGRMSGLGYPSCPYCRASRYSSSAAVTWVRRWPGWLRVSTSTFGSWTTENATRTANASPWHNASSSATSAGS